MPTLNRTAENRVLHRCITGKYSERWSHANRDLSDIAPDFSKTRIKKPIEHFTELEFRRNSDSV